MGMGADCRVALDMRWGVLVFFYPARKHQVRAASKRLRLGEVTDLTTTTIHQITVPNVRTEGSATAPEAASDDRT